MLIKVVFIAAAAIAGVTLVVIQAREASKPPAATVLRQPTPAERRLLDSIPTVAPPSKGGMH